jgi:hypothetical protein
MPGPNLAETIEMVTVTTQEQCPMTTNAGSRHCQSL